MQGEGAEGPGLRGGEVGNPKALFFLLARSPSNSHPKPVQGQVREIYIRENRSGPLAKGDSRTNPFERIVPGTRNQIAQRSCKVRATTLRSGWKPGQ